MTTCSIVTDWEGHSWVEEHATLTVGVFDGGFLRDTLLVEVRDAKQEPVVQLRFEQDEALALAKRLIDAVRAMEMREGEWVSS